MQFTVGGPNTSVLAIFSADARKTVLLSTSTSALSHLPENCIPKTEISDVPDFCHRSLHVNECLLFTNIGHRTCSANVCLTHSLVLSLEDQCSSVLLLFCTCSWSYTIRHQTTLDISHLSSLLRFSTSG